MMNLEVEDREQVHAAFLVYMDLTEGTFAMKWSLTVKVRVHLLS